MSLVSQALVAHCLHWSRNHIRCMGSHLAAHMSFWRSELWQPCMRSGSLQAAQRVPVAGRSASRWLVWQNLLELNLLEIINIQKASAVASLLSLSPPPVSCARCCFLAALAPSRASSSPLALLSAPGAALGLFRRALCCSCLTHARPWPGVLASGASPRLLFLSFLAPLPLLSLFFPPFLFFLSFLPSPSFLRSLLPPTPAASCSLRPVARASPSPFTPFLPLLLFGLLPSVPPLPFHLVCAAARGRGIRLQRMSKGKPRRSLRAADKDFSLDARLCRLAWYNRTQQQSVTQPGKTIQQQASSFCYRMSQNELKPSS